MSVSTTVDAGTGFFVDVNTYTVNNEERVFNVKTLDFFKPGDIVHLIAHAEIPKGVSANDVTLVDSTEYAKSAGIIKEKPKFFKV